MAAREPRVEPVNLLSLGDAVLDRARTASAGRAAQTVRGGAGLLRQSLLALVAGAELAEHESPPEATLHVLTGLIRLHGQGRAWELRAAEIIPIPPERHSVTAVEDSVFLLTVRRDIDPADDERQGPRL